VPCIIFIISFLAIVLNAFEHHGPSSRHPALEPSPSDQDKSLALARSQGKAEWALPADMQAQDVFYPQQPAEAFLDKLI